MKICAKCNLEKNDSQFHYFKGSKDNLYSQCKDCKKLYDKLYI